MIETETKNNVQPGKNIANTLAARRKCETFFFIRFNFYSSQSTQWIWVIHTCFGFGESGMRKWQCSDEINSMLALCVSTTRNYWLKQQHQQQCCFSLFLSNNGVMAGARCWIFTSANGGNDASQGRRHEYEYNGSRWVKHVCRRSTQKQPSMIMVKKNAIIIDESELRDMRFMTWFVPTHETAKQLQEVSEFRFNFSLLLI